MSWTKLAAVSASRVDRLTVRITSAGYKDKKPHVVIRIARSIAAECDLPTKEKSRVDVFLGDGAQAGRMLIGSNPAGDYSCYPSGKAGALKIAFSAPFGAPAEYPIEAVEATFEDGGLTFPLPWHVPAGEREVEDLPHYRTWNLSQLSPAALSAVRVQDYPHGPPPKLGAPSTLDAIEEAARPPEIVAERMTEEELVKGLDRLLADDDKPVNNPVRTHVYADSEDAEGKLTFTHNGKSCLLNKRQHVVVSKLYAVMLKKIPGGFLHYDDLIRASGVRDKYILQATVAGARKRITTLGLEIKAIEKTGYWMEAV